MKVLILLVVAVLVLAMIGGAYYFYKNYSTKKITSTIQYDSPIGPTQTEPFILPAKSLLAGVK